MIASWEICKKWAFTVHLSLFSLSLSSLSAVLYIGSNQSPKAISTFKCISTTVYHPVVYTAHKGRRQLPSENIQLHISNTHLKHSVCIIFWASGWNWVISQSESEKQSSDIFMWEYVISSSLDKNLCLCECLTATVFTNMGVLALEVCACAYLRVISVLSEGVFWSWGSLLSLCLTPTWLTLHALLLLCVTLPQTDIFRQRRD